MDDEELHEQLHSSAKENLPRTAEDLLRSLADVNHRDPLGYTALHTSCSRGFIQVAQLLQIHPQISLNLQTPDGWTALHLACMNGKGNAVKLLLRDSRVEVNLADKLGCSPLWYAAQGGHMEVVHWLLASGRKFDLGLKGKGMGRPLTAVQVARMIEREDLAALLEEYEADFTAVVGKLRQLLEITGKEGFKIGDDGDKGTKIKSKAIASSSFFFFLSQISRCPRYRSSPRSSTKNI